MCTWQSSARPRTTESLSSYTAPPLGPPMARSRLTRFFSGVSASRFLYPGDGYKPPLSRKARHRAVDRVKNFESSIEPQQFEDL